jgi:hypothetical protein
MRVETPREIVTFHLLEILTRHGVTFDPVVRHLGEASFDQAVARGSGVLLVGPHSMLSLLALRPNVESGQKTFVVSPVPLQVLGTSTFAQIVEPSFTYLLAVRKLLRENAIVTAMIDRDVVGSRKTFAVPTEKGPIVIANALIDVAARIGTPVVFIAARIIAGEIVITNAAPPAEAARSTEAITAAFVAFLQEHVAGVVRDEAARF